LGEGRHVLEFAAFEVEKLHALTPAFVFEAHQAQVAGYGPDRVNAKGFGPVFEWMAFR
jgi:hypothetical protein